MWLARVLALLMLAVGVVRADFTDEQTQNATPSQATCTGTSSVVSDYSALVRARTILNQSTTPVFLCFAPTCDLTTGTRFIENMGLVEQTYVGPISCITAGGTATLGVTVR